MEEIVFRDRRGTDCVKWDGLKEKFGEEDLIAMWVADMDFEATVCVKKALKEYVEKGVFGYYQVPDTYYNAFIDWEKKYHEYEVEKEWIRFSPGVVPAINWLIQLFTEEGDGVLFMPPVYFPFIGAVEANQRKKVECPLKNEDGIYHMDIETFEKKIQEEQVKVFILCSPHNPVGRVWSREELKEVLDICKKHHVYVIADEIHQDLIPGDRKKVTAATVGNYDEILVTLTAATKTFNLAGCSNAFVIIPDKKIRADFDRFIEKIHVMNGNAFGFVAVTAAYQGGRQWLDSVIEKIRFNYNRMKEMLEEQLPEAKVYPLEGTYLAWIDFGAYIPKEKMEEVIQGKAKVAVDFGSWFGGEEYSSFIRLNLATSTKNVENTINHIVSALK